MKQSSNALNAKNPLEINGHKHDCFFIIRNVDIHAGFCAIVTYVLNGIRKAEESNAIPVIHIDKSNTFDFYDPKYGENIWEYFFEPVTPYTYSQVQAYVSSGLISPHQIYTPSTEEVMKAHHREEGRLATFWAWDPPLDKTKWMEQKRLLGRQYVKKYVYPKANIGEKVNNFTQENFEKYHIIGVHIRGTDFGYAQPIKPETYFQEIDQIVLSQNLKAYKIFLATDQKQFVTIFKAKYGSRIITYDAFRSEDHIAPYRYKTTSPYKMGEDVLIDVLLLSRSNYLLKGPAAVGEVALWFNQNLKCTDFGLESDFFQISYDQVPNTFDLFNLGKKSSLKLKLHSGRQRAFRYLQGTRLIAPFYRKFQFVRKILRH